MPGRRRLLYGRALDAKLKKMNTNQLINYAKELEYENNRKGRYIKQAFAKIRFLTMMEHAPVRIKDKVDMLEKLKKFMGEEEQEKQQEDVKEKDDVNLTCNICLDDFDHRKVKMIALTCGHVMCAKCCHQLIEKNEVSIKCPSCRAKIETVIPLFCF